MIEEIFKVLGSPETVAVTVQVLVIGFLWKVFDIYVMSGFKAKGKLKAENENFPNKLSQSSSLEGNKKAIEKLFEIKTKCVEEISESMGKLDAHQTSWSFDVFFKQHHLKSGESIENIAQDSINQANDELKALISILAKYSYLLNEEAKAAIHSWIKINYDVLYDTETIMRTSLKMNEGNSPISNERMQCINNLMSDKIEPKRKEMAMVRQQVCQYLNSIVYS